MSKTIYTHKHHIIPRHAGGSDDPSNIVELTIEEHALAHKKLFFIYGRWQDEVAYLTLSGQISKAEAIKRAQREANLGNKHWLGKTHTSEACKKISDYQKVAKKGNQYRKGKTFTEESKQLISDSLKGNTNKLGKTGKQKNKWEGRSEYMKKNNPMSNPEVKERHRLACLKREEKKRNARIQS